VMPWLSRGGKATKAGEWTEELHPREGGRFASKPGGPAAPEEKPAEQPAANPASQPAATAAVPEQPPSDKTKSEIAKASATYVGKEIQRYCEEGNEPKLAEAVGGKSLADNEPVDVVCQIGGKTQGIEIKTLVSNKAGKVTMKAEAQARKAAWERKEPGRCHTVIFDDSKVFNARGPGQHDESQREIYYKRGFGSLRISAMYKCKDLAELKTLIAMDKRKLPKGAKGLDA
jgi:pyruvate/2-oxoglutarate dehydrogenase complex dihydrolipoamide acyltransferase (E2) component